MIINGPNLNLVGVREPDIYGTVSFDSYFKELVVKYENELELIYFQSNHEGDIIDKIHQIGFSSEGIVLNAGAYAHTSIAIADAIKAVTSIVVEVHMSNIYEREDFRAHSYLTDVCPMHYVGQGLKVYDLAIQYLLNASR